MVLLTDASRHGCKMFSMTKAMGCEWYHSLTGVRILPGQKKLIVILTGLSSLISFTSGCFEDWPAHQKQVAHISNSSTFQNVYWDIGQNKINFLKPRVLLSELRLQFVWRLLLFPHSRIPTAICVNSAGLLFPSLSFFSCFFLYFFGSLFP